jgi:hypothetical protein
MQINLSVKEFKELFNGRVERTFFNESSTNRIKPSSNKIPFENPEDKYIPSKKTIEDFKEIATEEAKKLKKPMPHKDFVKMGKDILDKNHKHRPGRPKKVIE